MTINRGITTLTRISGGGSSTDDIVARAAASSAQATADAIEQKRRFMLLDDSDDGQTLPNDGKYRVSTDGGSFAVGLGSRQVSDDGLTWEFMFVTPASQNTVAIGSSSDTFDNRNGSVGQGPLIVAVNEAELSLVYSAASPARYFYQVKARTQTKTTINGDGVTISEGVASVAETVALTIPANTPTPVPTTTAIPNVLDFRVLTASGDDITSSIDISRNGGVWSVTSSTEITNAQFLLEG